MKKVINNGRRITQSVLTYVVAMVFSITLLSCEKDNLNVQQDYPFEVTVMPVPKSIANGQTVEIRVTVERPGKYAGASYYIRYFQPDGTGTLRYYDNAPFKPNDIYALPETQFRLYYTSKSTVKQVFDVWISDNFGNEKRVTFEFASSDTRFIRE